MSGDGFTSPIIGGGGGLVYPAIKSPNFSKTASTGWSIDKNGDAYFYSVILGGGSLILTQSGGVFIYNGTPADGNRPIFWITDATEDPFGNTVSAAQGSTGLPSLWYT